MSDSNVVTLRANFQKSYLVRYWAMAGIGLFMAAYFAYDGFIGYPGEQRRCAAYEELASRVSDKSERNKQWQELARSKGWNVKTPDDKAADFDNKIQGQFVFGTICLVLSIPALYFVFSSKNRWIEQNAEELTTSWGQRLDLRSVYLLNKQRWANKGIAKAYYKDDGRERVFVFDDFKYDRGPLDQMLKNLESHLSPDQIVGGSPESDSTSDHDSNAE